MSCLCLLTASCMLEQRWSPFKWGDHQASESDRAPPVSNLTGYKLKQLFVSLNCCCYGHSLFTANTHVVQALSHKSKTPANDQEREQGFIEFLHFH